jgi:F-type H+-transporting ATPase subunit a
MASSILHIKDAYYFEVPRALWRSDRKSINDFPEHYIRLDDDYQNWEADRLYNGLSKIDGLKNVPPKDTLISQWHAWQHAPANFAKPLDRFLEEAPSQRWFSGQVFAAPKPTKLRGETEAAYNARLEAWEAQVANAETLQPKWELVKAEAEDLAEYKAHVKEWPAEKIAEYNGYLDGKIFIPQIFGAKLRNNYEKESGFAISKFMILELIVAAILILVFRKLARVVRDGRPAKGKLWNLFETFLLFIRDQIARPAIGHHDADRFVPLLWTIFMFVLSLNLLGMIPWLGSPTASFSVTLAMALVTFATVIIAGSMRFGPIGFWKNQVPHMGLPLVLAIPIVPMVFLIEVGGLFIRHGVLAVRLLANMVAGHLVLLAIMGLAVAAANSSLWGMTATISVIGSALFSLLELFVAFLQAYVFTFLSALFIGAAVHHH